MLENKNTEKYTKRNVTMKFLFNNKTPELWMSILKIWKRKSERDGSENKNRKKRSAWYFYLQFFLYVSSSLLEKKHIKKNNRNEEAE